ncbi:hypothetical protein [Aliiroseovarius sp. 2305UL8-7]|uniref:hypothetical protein n=1 Tax=Aliiroseovarius conchicola TaxID=3121637 RepID=UPI0035292C17
MLARRGIRLLALIVIVVTLPSAAALSWYHYTKDPTLRPLGISKNDPIREANGELVNIVAHIRWDNLNEAQPLDRFRYALVEAFDIKNIEITVDVVDAPGQGTTVVYDVGASHIGPFPKQRAAKGVNAAIAAYRMNQRPSPNQIHQ